MQTGELSFPTRIVLAVIVGLASLVLFLAATLVMLGEALRLTYRSAMTAFVVCCIASTVVSVLSGIGFLRSHVTGTERSRFISLAAVISIFLPLARPERTLLFENYWHFAFAAQYLISGLLGLAIAICKRGRGWWWLFAAWGTVLIGLGVMQVSVLLYLRSIWQWG